LILILVPAQSPVSDSHFRSFIKTYDSGDLIEAERLLVSILKTENSLSSEYRIAILNNLGATCNLLGKYEEALEYYNKAELLLSNEDNLSKLLGDLYINKAIIYGVQQSFPMASEYFERGIRFYQRLIINNPDKDIYSSLASAYLNYGRMLITFGDYNYALNLLSKSVEIKNKYNFTGLPLAYMNIAKTFVNKNLSDQAEKYFALSIEKFINDYDINYFRLAEVYFAYGLFLDSHNRYTDAFDIHKKALNICISNYGHKNSLTSLSYKQLGDHFAARSQYDSALVYYQKSLAAIVPDFESSDIFTNPDIDTSFFNLRLLDNLKSKAMVLRQMSEITDDTSMKNRYLISGLETIELALALSKTMRIDYFSEEDRLYFADSHKESCITAINIISTLIDQTGDESLTEKMFSIAQETKASVLRNELTENDYLYNARIPDTLLKKRTDLSAMIASYNNLLHNGLQGSAPDSANISLWKDDIFHMNRELEKINSVINNEFPEYRDFLLKTEPLPVSEIKRHLAKDETIVDFLFGSRHNDGTRDLYTFLVTRDKITVHKNTLDSLFHYHAAIIYDGHNMDYHSGDHTEIFHKYTSALSYMYDNLVKPVRKFFSGNKLIIVPDEEISWLSFEAFITKRSDYENANYESLRYLIYDYIISYSYASSLSFSSLKKAFLKTKVYSFVPQYDSSQRYGQFSQDLAGAAREIESVYRHFKGKKHTKAKATESNFRSALKEPVVFHLAMHAIPDTVNSRFSYMLFNSANDKVNDGKLHNYEISLLRINSPMVVLSACNSGTGTLYRSEGLMSLARSFTLAGAASVVMTVREVNDETSEAIISRYYYYLAKGRRKNEAMHSAKLDFLNDNLPSLKNPYYWSAYEVVGDTTPVVTRRPVLIVIAFFSVLLSTGFVIDHFRRRRIFSDRSL